MVLRLLGSVLGRLGMEASRGLREAPWTTLEAFQKLLDDRGWSWASLELEHLGGVLKAIMS